jgi:hypothetical protein
MADRKRIDQAPTFIPGTNCQDSELCKTVRYCVDGRIVMSDIGDAPSDKGPRISTLTESVRNHPCDHKEAQDAREQASIEVSNARLNL